MLKKLRNSTKHEMSATYIVDLSNARQSLELKAIYQSRFLKTLALSQNISAQGYGSRNDLNLKNSSGPTQPVTINIAINQVLKV